jgi:hypothetical protein
MELLDLKSSKNYTIYELKENLKNQLKDQKIIDIKKVNDINEVLLNKNFDLNLIKEVQLNLDNLQLRNNLLNNFAEKRISLDSTVRNLNFLKFKFLELVLKSDTCAKNLINDSNKVLQHNISLIDREILILNIQENQYLGLNKDSLFFFKQKHDILTLDELCAGREIDLITNEALNINYSLYLKSNYF